MFLIIIVQLFFAHSAHASDVLETGITHLNSGHYQQSLKIFVNLEKESPNDTVLLLNMAQAYRGLKKYTESLRKLKKVIEISDERTQVIAHFLSSEIEIEQQHYDEAMKHNSKALQKVSSIDMRQTLVDQNNQLFELKFPEIFLKLNALYDQSDVGLCVSFKEIAPSTFSVLWTELHLWCLSEERKYTEAMTLYSQYILFDPLNVNLRSTILSVALSLGDHQFSQQIINEIHTLDPSIETRTLGQRTRSMSIGLGIGFTNNYQLIAGGGDHPGWLLLMDLDYRSLVDVGLNLVHLWQPNYQLYVEPTLGRSWIWRYLVLRASIVTWFLSTHGFQGSMPHVGVSTATPLGDISATVGYEFSDSNIEWGHGLHVSLGVKKQKALNQWIAWRLSGGFVHERFEDKYLSYGERIPRSKNQYTFSHAWLFQLAPRFRASALGSISFIDFTKQTRLYVEDPYVGFLVYDFHRDDLAYKIEFPLEVSISDGSDLSFHPTFYWNRSNQTFDPYNKNYFKFDAMVFLRQHL